MSSAVGVRDHPFMAQSARVGAVILMIHAEWAIPGKEGNRQGEVFKPPASEAVYTLRVSCTYPFRSSRSWSCRTCWSVTDGLVSW
jgi:hypothetical protein